jgi:hypothetical protein
MGVGDDFHRNRLTGTGAGQPDASHPLYHLRTAPLGHGRPRTRGSRALPGAPITPAMIHRRVPCRVWMQPFWWGVFTTLCAVIGYVAIVFPDAIVIPEQAGEWATGVVRAFLPQPDL